MQRSTLSYLICFFIILTTLCLFDGVASAVTISASPTIASPGQEINITVHSAYLRSEKVCSMQINFGDSPTWKTLLPLCISRSCVNYATHVYRSPGSYLIRTRLTPGSATCLALLVAPTTASTTVTITPPPDVTLPDGVVGMSYAEKLGNLNTSFQLIAGQMAPGLAISRNMLQGIPEQEGRYRFQVRDMNALGAATETWYNLKVTKSLLTVTTTPQKVEIDRNRASSFSLTYTFKSSKPLSDTLESSSGIFFVGNRQLGTVNRVISTRMSNGSARLSEEITVPLKVLKTAQRLRADTIRYQRTFTARYLDAATTSSTAIAVGTGFTFTNIRIYFADHTSKKFVKRNERNIGASVDLRYEGAGLLKGHWQADNRILARVTKSLPFADGRTITLKLPTNPPLPTYATGSHRLRFVITEPVMNIVFPEVIYMVTGEDLTMLHQIDLVGPADRAEIKAGEMNFSWEKQRNVAIYRLEFFVDPDQAEPIFSAFSQKLFYTMPNVTLLQQKFIENQTYYWRVTGLDVNNNPVAGSKTCSFFLRPR